MLNRGKTTEEYWSRTTSHSLLCWATAYGRSLFNDISKERSVAADNISLGTVPNLSSPWASRTVRDNEGLCTPSNVKVPLRWRHIVIIIILSSRRQRTGHDSCSQPAHILFPFSLFSHSNGERQRPRPKIRSKNRFSCMTLYFCYSYGSISRSTMVDTFGSEFCFIYSRRRRWRRGRGWWWGGGRWWWR